MNISITNALARILARQFRRALLIRETSALSPDDEPVFGIAPIQMVAEQRIQALAYGRLGSPPQIAINENPLNREISCLEPFANALDQYLMSVIGANRIPRIWLPYVPALTALELLGCRYRYNKQVSQSIRRMGWQCCELVQEATFAGQQVIAIATRLFTNHFVTGQSPIEDQHLGALLAWVNPTSNGDPALEARHRALQPAAALLERRDDNRVEFLRSITKVDSSTARGQAAKIEIQQILTRAATKEWQLLNDARNAYWHSEISTDRDYQSMIDASLYRIKSGLEKDFRVASKPHSLSRRLTFYENALEVIEDLDMRADVKIRELAKRTGRAFDSIVVDIIQPKRNCRPCKIILETSQTVLRVRTGTEISTTDNSIAGEVLCLSESSHSRLIEVEIKKGVRASALPAIGEHIEWVTTSTFEIWSKNKVFNYIAESNSPLIFGDSLPLSNSYCIAEIDFVAVAEDLKRKS